MTAIHVVSKYNRAVYSDILDAYYRERHRVFVSERGWSELARPDGREIDQYDTDDAIYLLALDGMKLVGGQRLYPTTLDHMLSDVFPHLAQRSLPRGPDVLEWTRYFVVRERRFGRTDGRLLLAVQDYCLEAGISELTAVVEMWWLPRWQQYGFKTRPLGLPQVVQGQPTIAVAIEVSERARDAVQRMCGLKRAPFRHAGVEAPLAARDADAA